jgi:hypothetical protein
MIHDQEVPLDIWESFYKFLRESPNIFRDNQSQKGLLGGGAFTTYSNYFGFKFEILKALRW